MDNLELYEKIDAYLRKQLSAQEKNAFEAAIAKDEDLAMEVEIQRLYIDAGEVLIEQDLKEQVNNWKAEIKSSQDSTTTNEPIPPTTKTAASKAYLLAIVAVVVMALLVLYLLWLNSAQSGTGDQSEPNKDQQNLQDSPRSNSKDSTSLERNQQQLPGNTREQKTPNDKPPIAKGPIADLLNEYYESPTGTIRSPQPGEVESPYELAARNYNDGQYATALNQLANIPPTAPNLNNIQLLKAYCHFQLQHYAEAEAIFSDLAKLKMASADWGLAMTFLAQGPKAIDKLRAKLELIRSEPFHDYGGRAEKLLADLEKVK
jgi:Anaphase-promoting complex, cyclosome, subunit 3